MNEYLIVKIFYSSQMEGQYFHNLNRDASVERTLHIVETSILVKKEFLTFENSFFHHSVYLLVFMKKL